MLSKKNRFTEKYFNMTFKKGHKIKIENCLFCVSPAHKIHHFAISVSKKSVRLAVDRNKIRRQLYEIVRLNLLPHIPPMNIICLYKYDKFSHNPQNFARICEALINKLTKND